MSRSARNHGYTIIEVMIFLAISGVLLLIAAGFINGPQQGTQFSQGLHDFESKMEDLVNNVATGNYPDAGKFNCNVNTSSGVLTFDTGTNTQGTNQNCAFIGKFIQLAPKNIPDGLNIFTVAARRLDDNGAEIQQLDSSLATPVAIAPNITNNAGIELTDKQTLRWGVKTTRIVSALGHQDVAGVGLISDFGHYGSAGTTNLVSGAQAVTLVLPLGTLNQDLTTVVGSIHSLKEADRTRGQEGAIVCFTSANDNRRGAVTISAAGGTNVIIDQLDQTIGVGICP